MIEPPQFGAEDGAGYTYPDFDGAAPESYLHQTRDWVGRYLATTWPLTYRMRIQVSTTSDWTTLDIPEDEARDWPVWSRPERISASESATAAGFEAGDRLLLTQSPADANAGKEVQMTWDLLLTSMPESTASDLILQIDRGDLGKTQVTLFNFLGETPVEVKTIAWDQVTSGRNSRQIVIPLELLTEPNP